MKTAYSRLDDARISLKHSMIICRELKNKKSDDAESFLESLISKKANINKKYHTSAAKKILEILKTAEANAKMKNLNTEKLFIRLAKADKGEVFMRPKSRWRFRGRKAKVTRVKIELEER